VCVCRAPMCGLGKGEEYVLLNYSWISGPSVRTSIQYSLEPTIKAALHLAGIRMRCDYTKKALVAYPGAYTFAVPVCTLCEHSPHNMCMLLFLIPHPLPCSNTSLSACVASSFNKWKLLCIKPKTSIWRWRPGAVPAPLDNLLLHLI